jgi:hypothetical protein
VPRKLSAQDIESWSFLPPTLDAPSSVDSHSFTCDVIVRISNQSARGFFLSRAILTIVKRSDQAAVRLCRIVAG